MDLRDKINELPEFVKANMRESYLANSQISKKFQLNDDEAIKMIRVIVEILIKSSPLEELPQLLKNAFPTFKEAKLKDLALEICYKRFYPLRDYLNGIDILIKRLGGKIPENVPLYSQNYQEKGGKKTEINIKKEDNLAKEKNVEVKTNLAQDGQNKQIEYLSIREAIEKYPSILKQFISAKPIKLKDTEYLVNPTIKNWLKDYVDNLGVGPHSDYERINYLFHSENGKKLDQIDRNIVNCILKSYDKTIELPIDIQAKQVIISKLVSDSNVSPQEVEPEIKGNIVNLKNKKIN